MNNDTFEIKHENGHYILKVNKVFYGSYDTFSEAMNEIEEIKRAKEKVAV